MRRAAAGGVPGAPGTLGLGRSGLGRFGLGRFGEVRGPGGGLLGTQFVQGAA